MESNIATNYTENLPNELFKNTRKNSKEKMDADVHQNLDTDSNIEIRPNSSEHNLPSLNVFESDLEFISLDDECMTPKAQSHSSTSNVRRWASVVKAKKKLLPSETDVFETGENQIETKQDNDFVFKTLSKSVKEHQGFISSNQSSFTCNVCNSESESLLTLSNHVETRKHGNNIITCLEKKLPPSLHHIFDFVSFYGSNLCCNLCRSEIDLSSRNLYETIVNIIIHNTATNHKDHQVAQGNGNEVDSLIRSLVQNAYPDIRERICYIEMRMSPLYKCKLCEQNILYSENINTLVQNFVSHLKSDNHLSNQRAFETLKQFSEGYNSSYFSVKNGNIFCDQCNLFIEPSLERMIFHLNEVMHIEHALGRVNITSTNIKCADYELVVGENQSPMDKLKVATVITSEADKKNGQSQSSDTNCTGENEEGSVSCLTYEQDSSLSVGSLQTDISQSRGSSHSKYGTLNNFELGSPVSDDKDIVKGNILNDLQEEFRNIISFKNNNNINEAFCLVCQIDLAFSGTAFNDIQGHLLSAKHHRKEFACLMRCTVCSRNTRSLSTEKNSTVIALKNFRKSGCLERQRLPNSTQNLMYNLLLKNNSLVYDNRHFLEINIDGMHIYCKLCKALIQYSIYLNKFETNVTNHLNGQAHFTSFLKQNSETINCVKAEFSDSQTTTPSPSNFQSKLKGSEKVKNRNVSTFKTEDDRFNQALYKVVRRIGIMTKKPSQPIFPGAPEPCSRMYMTGSEDDSFSNQSEPAKRILPSVVSNKTKHKKDIVASSNENLPCNSAKSKTITAITKPFLLTYREETKEETIKRREKQIEYGKNTLGYTRYCTKVPKSKRRPHHPETPPKHLKCSRRAWDEMVRIWRKRLHEWDPPTLTRESLDKDIQPLTTLA